MKLCEHPSNNMVLMSDSGEMVTATLHVDAVTIFLQPNEFELSLLQAGGYLRVSFPGASIPDAMVGCCGAAWPEVSN